MASKELTQNLSDSSAHTIKASGFAVTLKFMCSLEKVHPAEARKAGSQGHNFLLPCQGFLRGLAVELFEKLHGGGQASGRAGTHQLGRGWPGVNLHIH